MGIIGACRLHYDETIMALFVIVTIFSVRPGILAAICDQLVRNRL